MEKKNTTIKSCPIKKEVILKGLRSGKDTSVEMYDYNGEQISLDNRIKKKVLDVSGFSNGLYFIIYKKGGVVTKTLNCFVN